MQKLKSLFRKARWSVGALGRVGAISLGISALALIALSAFLYTLSNNQASHEDDCQELEVLSTAECDRLHGDPAGTLWVIAIGLAVLAGCLHYWRRWRSAVETGVRKASNRSQLQRLV